MKKEFFKDYLLSEEIKSIEILNSKIDYSYQEGKCNAFKIICKIKQKTLNQDDIKDYEIEINNFEFPCEFKDQLKAEIVNINYLLTSLHLVIYGSMEINQIERDEVSFTFDPFKKSLIDSFVEFKRNQQESVASNSSSGEVNQSEECLILADKSSDNLDKLEKNDSSEIVNCNLKEQELERNPLEFLKNKENVEIITTLSDKELENGFDLIKKDDQINVEDDHIIIEEPPIAVDKNLDITVEENNIQVINEKKPEKEEIIRDNYVTSFFYYRLSKGETLTDVLVKYKITMAEFLKYNHEKDYKENSLIKIKK